jgi:amino acid transporter
VLGLGWLAGFLYVDAVVSPAGTALIYTTSTSRVSYGLAGNGYFPQALARTNRRGVPWIGLLVSLVVGVVCFLPFPSWQQLVSFITSASVLMYAGAPLAYGALRRRLPHHHRPYRLPAGGLVSPLSFVVATLIVYWSGWGTLWRLGLAVLLGYALMGCYAGYARAKGLPHAPTMQLRSAQWLPVYLLGVGVVSWQGGFGGTGRIPLGWDIVLVAALALVVYYWAIAVALGTADIQAAIRDAETH